MRSTSARVSLFAAACALAFAAVAACGGGSDSHGLPTGTTPFTPTTALRLQPCGTSTALMTVSPVPMADLLGWVPLGNMSPPGHLFPTDHQYLYINDPGNAASVRQVNVVAPAAVTITRAHRTHYSNSDTYDYALEMGLCDEVRAEFGHVTTLAPDLLAQLGAFDQQCASYGLGVGTSVVFTSCYTNNVAVTRAAGQAIGTTGGQGTSFALDFTLRDRRRVPLVYANQARWTTEWSDLMYTVPASDYFAEPARSAIRARMGNYNNSQLRTAEPVGGAIAYDVPGSARGVWVNPAQPTFPDSPHLAIVPDVIDPSRVSISLGTSQPGFPAGLYQFSPQPGGLVNREPAQVGVDGNVYCFEFYQGQGVLLMKLETASSLRVEGRAGYNTTCATEQPWVFGAGALVYVR